jgi:hypothetical protein
VSLSKRYQYGRPLQKAAQVKRDIDVVRLPVILQALHLIEEIARLDILSAIGDHESMEVRFIRFFAEENIGQSEIFKMIYCDHRNAEIGRII